MATLNPVLREFWAERTRFKVLVGGRDSTKSWDAAGRAIMIAQSVTVRVMCARQYQARISQSVYTLLKTQIERFGLSDNFEILKSSIVCKSTGSEFLFYGLHLNFSEIKSTEGIDILWLEEAHALTKAQWIQLEPTIRKEHSQVWVVFNPQLESDFAYQRFIKNPPKSSSVRHINYDENQFLSQTSRDTIEQMKVDDYELYSHVYLGQCLTRSDDMIFAGKFRVADFEPTPEWSGPHMGLDFGFSTDPTAAVEIWVNDNKLYVRREGYKHHLELDHTTDELKRAIPGIQLHTIRADCARPESISYLQRHGLPKIIGCKKWPGSVEDGIMHMRSYADIVIHSTCRETATEFLMYRYATDRLSGAVLPDIIDKHNHLIDSIRYAIGPLIQQGTGPMIGFA